VSDTQLDAFKAWATADANEAEWVILRSDAAVLVAELERRTAALRDIRNLPSDHDLMHNPIAKAVYTIADAALAGGARAAQEGK
jgi:hypothetical protein